MDKHVYYSIEEEIAIITMNSPPVNAFTKELQRDFLQVLSELKQKTLRSAVITGTGEYFQAGGDMNRFLEIESIEDAEVFVKNAQDFMNEVAAVPCPVIAAINGYALGGGLEIALACDIRIASKSAKLGFPEVGYGILPGAGGTQRLARLIGTGQAKLLMYTGRHISADKALAIGVVDMVAEPDELLQISLDLAKEISQNSPIAAKHIKKSVDEGIEVPLEKGLAIERDYWARLIPYKDYLEGVRAWFEKRPPKFLSR
jgi:enoyl-CoA hydratase/carnithine racemase